eukprot:761118-Hanusia_phi.AAC.4
MAQETAGRTMNANKSRTLVLNQNGNDEEYELGDATMFTWKLSLCRMKRARRGAGHVMRYETNNKGADGKNPNFENKKGENEQFCGLMEPDSSIGLPPSSSLITTELTYHWVEQSCQKRWNP